MKLPASIAIASILAFSSTAIATPERTQTRIVNVADSISVPCLSVPMKNDVTVSLPESTLTALVVARKESWQTEQERLALLAGNRAQQLLAAKTDAVDVLGCKIVEHENNDSLYLVAQMIESGTAAVSVAGKPGFVRTVQVISNNCEKGWVGGMSFAIPGEPVFLFLVTCIS